MVNHSGEYIWSSYHAKALGKIDWLIEPLPPYLALSEIQERRYEVSREVFRHHPKEKA